MELKIKEYQLPQPPSFNYEELKEGLLQKVAHYETLVYTEDQIRDAKADLAGMRKLKTALNDERIRQEKEYMQPFNEFKAQIAELISIIDKPVLLIDKQVKEYEETKKQEKHHEIEMLFDGTEHPDWLKLEQIFNPKWLNASVNMKTVTTEIDERLLQITTDLATLSNLPEFGFEASELYKTTLDINKAIQEGNRLAEIQKKKAEQEAKMKEAAEKIKEAATKAGESIQETAQAVAQATKQDKQEVCFRCWISTEDAAALRELFTSRGIKYQAI